MPILNTTQPHLSCSRTYRLTASQAFELDKTAILLGITESELVRRLVKQGIDKIWDRRK